MERRFWIWMVVVLSLLLFWGRALVNIRDQSPVVDEPLHMTRAAAYWRTGDLRLQYSHPPLSHALSGAFLALEPRLPSPADLPGWDRASITDVSRHLLLEPARPIDRALFLSRWPILALGLILSALIGRWSGELFGPEAGLAALFLSTFAPNILAHSTLATTDLPVTCLTYAACYTFHRWLDRPTSGRLLLAGCVLGLAWGAKLSALILAPAMGLGLAWSVWRRRERWQVLLGGFAAILVVATAAVWALYRFEIGTWRRIGAPVPMPGLWDGLWRLWKHQSRGHPTFFLGHLSQGGWWYYFPVLFAIKTPLPLSISLLGAVVVACRPPRRRWPSLIVIFPLSYLAASVVSQINIGYRHILPVLPFVLLTAASAFRGMGCRSWRLMPILIGLSVWMMVSSLRIHPYYLAYFNELVGGPDQGYRYAVDSNLDWGQDLRRLKVYLDGQGIDQVKLSYFGTARPERYGIRYKPLLDRPALTPLPDFSPLNPEAGVYAISASNLQGVLLKAPDVFDWFRRREPTAKIGYSIFVYDVEERRQGEWAAVCYAPTPAEKADRIRKALGDPDLRLAYFDCRSSWVYPAGSAPGWYLIPETRARTVISAYLDEEQILFQGQRTSSREELTVYRGEGAEDRGISLTPLKGRERPRLADVARFLGYQVEPTKPAPGSSFVLRTYWKALDQPEVPLSVMAHLVNGRGTTISIADGLGFTAENWRKGDVFAQMHRFELPSKGKLTSYTFRVGLYRLDTMERLEPARLETDYVALTPFEESER